MFAARMPHANAKHCFSTTHGRFSLTFLLTVMEYNRLLNLSHDKTETETTTNPRVGIKSEPVEGKSGRNGTRETRETV